MAPRTARSEAGFSLTEMMIAMGIMLLVMAGTFSAMTSAMRAEQAARGITVLNGNLRSSMDLVVRDFLQIGQGLQTGRYVTLPTGPGSVAVNRPGPTPAAAGACGGVTTFAVSPTLSAVSVGPDRGPAINTQCTDIITSIAVDGAFENVNVSSMAVNGRSITIIPTVNITDVPDVGSDNLRVGDILELRRGTGTATVYVTAVAGQTVTFGTGVAIDPLRLNQFDVALNMLGTTNQLRVVADPAAPVVVAGVTQPGPWGAYRIRMISYFIDTTGPDNILGTPDDPASPRLMRQMNASPAQAVAFELESFRISYDLANGVNNPAGVRMSPADLGLAGACAPSACSPNQVRKANVTLAIRSEQRTKENGYYHNALFTQVAIRSLSFVDRYP